MEVQGGGQRGVWRWTESVQRYAEDCIGGMQRYVEVQRGLQRYVEVHERYVAGLGRCEEVQGGICRCVIGWMEGTWRCTKVHGGVHRGTEIGRGVQRCTEESVSVWRGVLRSERCMELHM